MNWKAPKFKRLGAFLSINKGLRRVFAFYGQKLQKIKTCFTLFILSIFAQARRKLIKNKDEHCPPCLSCKSCKVYNRNFQSKPIALATPLPYSKSAFEQFSMWRLFTNSGESPIARAVFAKRRAFCSAVIA